MTGRKSLSPLEQVLQEQRQRVSDQVRQRFARYGDDVCGLILTAALQPNGLQKLLIELQLPPSAQFVEQLDRLSRLLAGVGAFEFLRMSKLANAEKGLARPSLQINPF